MMPLPGYHNAMFQSWDEAKILLDDYRAAWAAANHPGTPQVVVRAPAYIRDTEEAAWAAAEQVYGRVQDQRAFSRWVLEGSGVASFFRDHPAAYERARPTLEDVIPHGVPVDEVIRSYTITGSAEFAVDYLRRLEDELGVTGVMLEGSGPHREDLLTTLRVVADQVMPHFRALREPAAM
jgi:alkanesulfonate monooxygenase SsuD/methylene tetrahydromethanopterin reductase-like flavin-dependent oxidoreductase (luciferase family)